MSNAKRILIPLLLLPLVSSFFSGCTTPPPPPSRAEYTHESDKNYKLNVPMQCFVGEKLITRKDYFSRAIVRNDVVVASTSFRLEHWGLTGKNGEANFESGQLLQVVGIKSVDDRACRIISLGGPTGFAIDDEGHIKLDHFYMNTFRGPVAQFGQRFVAYPSDAKLKSYSKVEIDNSKPFVNYEILYTGKSGGSFNLVYREYTPEDFAKTAFYQNLSYDNDSGVIRFRNLQIRVDRVTNEGITFTVIGD